MLKKKKKGTKTKFLWRNPQLLSYRLTSVLRALKQSSVCFSFSRDVTLCPLAPFSLSYFFHKRKQNNKVGFEFLVFIDATDALYSHWCRREPWPCPLIISLFISASQSSVDDFVDCGLLVPGASDNELIIRRDITAED